jgi:hypothetical protein
MTSIASDLESADARAIDEFPSDIDPLRADCTHEGRFAAPSASVYVDCVDCGDECDQQRVPRIGCDLE